METEVPEHFIYVKASMEEAEGVAQVFSNEKSQLSLYPFKFPELDSTDVRLKVLYTGLCQSDCFHARKHWSDHVTYPICPGHEIVGEVTMVGKDCKTIKVGDIVGGCPQRDNCRGECGRCKEGRTNVCEKNWTGMYDPFFGGYATHAQFPEHFTFKIPDGMPLDRISPLLCAGITVFHPLKRHAQKGYKCAILGIGGLGHLAIGYASKMGMEVTAFTTSFDREAELKALGAHKISHSTDVASLQKESRQYDLVLSTMFASQDNLFKKHLELTRKGGKFAMVGLPSRDQQITINVNSIVFNNIEFFGSCIGSIQGIHDMLQFSKEHEVYPIVEQYPFDQFNVAFEKLEKGRPKYRVVVNVKDWTDKNFKK